MPASCSTCTTEQRIEHGCEGSEELQWIDETCDIQYYVCPAKFVTEKILEWFAEYQYLTKYPTTAKNYRDQSNKFLIATTIYEEAHALNNVSANGRSLS